MDPKPDLTDPKLIEQLQGEIISLITAWADRGIAPSDSAMVLTANAHMILAKLGFSLGEVVTLLADGWRQNDGKL